VKIRWKRGQMVIAVLLVMLLAFTAACGSGDDDDDGDTETPAATSTATTGAAQSDSTPTEADEEDDAEATPSTDAPSATATESEDDEATATTGTQATATVAATESSPATATTSSGDPTATSASGEPTTDTGGIEDIPDIETLDPELLPNFSMAMSFDATNFSGTPQTTLQMEMQQSAIDHYRFLMVADGEELEFWTIGEQSWTSLAGEIIESPTGPLFSPSDMLSTSELIPEGLNARQVGTEEVNGRQTTKWVVDGADYVAYMNEETQAEMATVEMTNGAGEVSIWIDNEFKIMIKADGDVTWDNSDDTQGALVYTYEIFDIGSTADIVAPV